MITIADYEAAVHFSLGDHYEPLAAYAALALVEEWEEFRSAQGMEESFDEAGDVLWSIAALAQGLGASIFECIEAYEFSLLDEGSTVYHGMFDDLQKLPALVARTRRHAASQLIEIAHSPTPVPTVSQNLAKLAGLVKKGFYHEDPGNPSVHKDKAIELLGQVIYDVTAYMVSGIFPLGIDEVMFENTVKIKARYPEGFTAESWEKHLQSRAEGNT